MKREDINIRDPFILPYEGKYYLYGSRGSEVWEDNATGLDVYVSEDLENWSEPIEIFTRTADFWADRHYWAPEVYAYNGAFYMFASFKSADRCRGTMVLKADKPVLLDIWAVWCGPCQMQSPILDQVAEEFGVKIKVCKVNVDEQPSLALNYQIASIPTLVFMKYGLFQQRMIGLQDKQTITDYLQTLLDAE